MTLPHDDLGATWRAAREHLAVTHLDAAGCSVASRATLDAVSAYLEREAAYGGYPVQRAVAVVVAGALDRLAALLGLPAGATAWVHNAAEGFSTVLGGWPLPARARVGCTAADYASNAMLLATGASRGEVVPVRLRTDDDGLLDLDDLDRALAAGLDLVTLAHIASHRGVVQPAAEIVARCRTAGVPVVLDVAQSLGQVDVSGVGADAYVGTSRKWLCGPRGLGFVGLSAPLLERLRPAPSVDTHIWDGDLLAAPTPLGGAQRIGAGEVSVAAQIGLANALDELAAAGPSRVAERIAALGALGRDALDGRGGWTVQEPPGAASGSVVLDHPDRAAAEVHQRLQAAGVVTSLVDVARAPADLPRPRLRMSCHAYCTEADVQTAARALEAASA